MGDGRRKQPHRIGMADPPRRSPPRWRCPAKRQILAPRELLQFAALGHAGQARESKGRRSFRVMRRTYGQSPPLALSRAQWRSTAGSSSTSPAAWGSTQAVAAVKRALREAGEPKTKTGHGGTLDPLATGVLPIALGEATKVAGRMLDATKAYDFTIGFGEETDTLDLEGKVVATSEVRPTRVDVEAILPSFTGPIEPGSAGLLRAQGRREARLRPRSRR